MRRAEVGRHGHVPDPFKVANRAVDDESRASGALHDVVEEVVANDGPVLVHAEEVDHQHIARLEHVDRDLVVHAADAKRLCVGIDHRVQVGTHGHELHREGAPDELLTWMQNLEAVGELVAVVLAGQHRQHFLGR